MIHRMKFGEKIFSPYHVYPVKILFFLSKSNFLDRIYPPAPSPVAGAGRIHRILQPVTKLYYHVHPVHPVKDS